MLQAGNPMEMVGFNFNSMKERCFRKAYFHKKTLTKEKNSNSIVEEKKSFTKLLDPLVHMLQISNIVWTEGK